MKQKLSVLLCKCFVILIFSSNIFHTYNNALHSISVCPSVHPDLAATMGSILSFIEPMNQHMHIFVGGLADSTVPIKQNFFLIQSHNLFNIEFF